MDYRFTWLIFLNFAFLFGFSLPGNAQDTFQLAPPYLHYHSVFFEKEAIVDMAFAQAGTQIHYTTNGKLPGEKDPVYIHSVHVKKNFSTLKARVFGQEFKPSDVTEVTFFKSGLAIQEINATLPHEKYPGSGRNTLIDGFAGIDAYSSRNWAGFQIDTVMVHLTMTKVQKVKQVLIHALQHQDAWIFLPQKVEVFGIEEISKNLNLLAVKTLQPTEKSEKNASQALLIDLPHAVKTRQLILKIYPLDNIPDWHPGKGKPAWLFMDEVKLY